MMPVTARQLAITLRDDYRSAATAVACKRVRAVDAECQLASLIGQGQQICLLLGAVDLDPGRSGKSLVGQQPQTRAGGHRDALAAGELDSAGDQRRWNKLRRGGTRIVLVRRGVE